MLQLTQSMQATLALAGIPADAIAVNKGGDNPVQVRCSTPESAGTWRVVLAGMFPGSDVTAVARDGAHLVTVVTRSASHV